MNDTPIDIEIVLDHMCATDLEADQFRKAVAAGLCEPVLTEDGEYTFVATYKGAALLLKGGTVAGKPMDGKSLQ